MREKAEYGADGRQLRRRLLWEWSKIIGMTFRIIKWYYLLNKRLFKKLSFILILCLVPLLVGGMNILSREESGIVRIALCPKNPEDESAVKIIDELMSKDSVLRYVLCEDESEARRMVMNSDADAAWLFSENFQSKLQKAAAKKRCEPVVTVIEREDNVSLQFTRQLLVNKIYSDFSYLIYEDFVKDDLALNDVSDTKLREAYDKMSVDGSLFQMEYLDGQPAEAEDYNYLLTPIRGILSVWFVLCGFAASMYFMQDEQNGMFSRVALKNRLWAALGMHAVVLSDAAAVLLIACKSAGVFTTWSKELAAAILLTASTTVFCNLIRLMCRTPERLGACIPILLTGMLVMCPVFINLRNFKMLPYLLPPYYYLKSIHSAHHLYGMMIYTGALFVLCLIIFQWRCRSKG